MIKIIIHNHYNNSKKVFEIQKMYDFDHLSVVYGKIINTIAGQYKNIRTAADAVAEYLSNSHLDATVYDSDDLEEVYDPNIEEEEIKEAKSAIDLKDSLENKNKTEDVDIPDVHVINSATHRWDK